MACSRYADRLDNDIGFDLAVNRALVLKRVQVSKRGQFLEGFSALTGLASILGARRRSSEF
jgi:hypothetical protein